MAAMFTIPSDATIRRCACYSRDCLHSGANGDENRGTAAYAPTEAEAGMLDGLTLAWRYAVTMDRQDLYRVASDALRDALVALYGTEAGTAIRSEMADNFEDWYYNACVERTRRDFEAGLCRECGQINGEHYVECDRHVPMTAEEVARFN